MVGIQCNNATFQEGAHHKFVLSRKNLFSQNSVRKVADRIIVDILKYLY